MAPAPAAPPYLRRSPLGSRCLQLPPRPEEEEEEEGGEPEHPQQRQRQTPRRPPHPREGWEKSGCGGMQGRGAGRGGRWAPPGAAGAGLGGEEGAARPPASEPAVRVPGCACSAGEGRRKEEEVPGGRGLEPEPLTEGRCCAQAAGLAPRARRGSYGVAPLTCSFRRGPHGISGAAAARGRGHRAHQLWGYKRGRPSLTPPTHRVATGRFQRPRADSERMRGAGQHRCQVGPGWSLSRSSSGSGARESHCSTTHAGGLHMKGRFIYPIETARGIRVGGI